MPLLYYKYYKTSIMFHITRLLSWHEVKIIVKTNAYFHITQKVVYYLENGYMWHLHHPLRFLFTMLKTLILWALWDLWVKLRDKSRGITAAFDNAAKKRITNSLIAIGFMIFGIAILQIIGVQILHIPSFFGGITYAFPWKNKPSKRATAQQWWLISIILPDIFHRQ